MNTGSKILIIEDERSGISAFSKILCSILPSSESEREQKNREWNSIPENMPRPASDEKVSEEDKKEYYFNQFNNFWEGNIICPRSFKDAYRLINNIGIAEDYELIFIDRNLEKYGDFDDDSIQIDKKQFTPDFFKGLNGFAGDYFFINLVNAGVPIEKICFLTANNDSAIDALEKSPLLHQNRLPRIITKSVDDNDLKKILKDSHGAKIRFLYRDIFANEKVQEIFGPYVEEFIAALARRYKYGSNAKYRKGDGILLRNMVEVVVTYICKTCFPSNPDLQTCRDVLNYEDSGYNPFYEKFVLKDWWHYLNKYGHLPDSNDLNNISNDLMHRVSYYRNNQNKANDQAQKIIDCTNDIKTLTALQAIYRNSSKYINLPKYIFSYIDNIYTITSEFSAHGRNDKTTNGLSVDGWEALLSGMIQIMQWVAATNPNPNPQSLQN